MEKINLKFYLPFKRNDGDEQRRLKSLKNKTATMLSPYHTIGIVVGEDEIKLPIAAIKAKEATKVDGVDWTICLNDQRSGRHDRIGDIKYDNKVLNFKWEDLNTGKVHDCTVEVDLG